MRVLHLTTLGEQGSDVALELLRPLLLLGERVLQYRGLVVDERLALDSGPRESFLAALHMEISFYRGSFRLESMSALNSRMGGRYFSRACGS